MALHINVNGREIKSPLGKFLFALGVLLLTAIIVTVVVFVLLPLIGFAISLSVGFVAVVVVAVFVGLALLALGAVLAAVIWGPLELVFGRRRQK